LNKSTFVQRFLQTFEGENYLGIYCIMLTVQVPSPLSFAL
jgi:hypothetical protein